MKITIVNDTRANLSKLFKEGENEVTNPTYIADRFHKSFKNIGPILGKSIPKSRSLHLKYTNDKIKESVPFSNT